jgi:membrane dipeptidase
MRTLILSALVLVATPALAASPEEVALAALARSPVIDGHNDTPEQLRELFGNDPAKFDLRALPPEARAKTHTDIPALRAGRVGGQFWSVWVDPSLDPETGLRQVLEQIDTVEQFVARYPDIFRMARTAADIEAARKAGRIASLIGMEGGAPINGSLAVLRQLRRAGVGYLTLTHYLTTDWADSATDAPKHDGLSPFGVDVVHEMNRIGMLVDLSHVSEATMNDVLDAAKAPVIFSHSDAKALDDHPRNVPDAVLKRLPANGGIVMINFLPDYVSAEVRAWSVMRSGEEARLKALHIGAPEAATAALAAWEAAHPRPRATLAQVADHIDHVRRVSGIDHIGLGSDFGGISTVPQGLETVADFPALFTELARRGYSQSDLEKIAAGNILRVMRAAEAVAGR